VHSPPPGRVAGRFETATPFLFYFRSAYSPKLGLSIDDTDDTPVAEDVVEEDNAAESKMEEVD